VQAKRLLALRINRIFEEVRFMDTFWTIVVILVILWLLGFSLGLVGNLIHILLVAAIIVILIRIIQGRKPL
jgi:small basic protein